MANPRDTKRLELENRLKKQAHDLAKTILDYLFLLGMSGIKTPVPPRPMREAVRQVTFAAQLLEFAVRAPRGWREM